VLAAAGHRIVGIDRCTIRAATQRLFARGRHALSLEERVIDRYDHPKWVWERVLEKKSD
jgi:hypothetical protein